MKKYSCCNAKISALSLLTIILIIITGCTPATETPGITSNDIHDTFTNHEKGYQVLYPPYNGSGILNYSLDLSTYTKNVYFIITNTALTDTGESYPLIERKTSIAKNVKNKNIQTIITNQDYSTAGTNPINQKNFPDIDVQSPCASDPVKCVSSDNSIMRLNSYGYTPLASTAQVDDTAELVSHLPGINIPATCRLVRTVTAAPGSKTLNIWVADNCWYVGGTKAYTVNPTMVTALADKFLTTGLSNDIYDVVTDIFGEEWGSDAAAINSSLISADNVITIFLYDINNDNSTNGGYLGYFHPDDLFTNIFSNEKVMIYLDAVLFANDGGFGWHIDMYWPSVLTSTAAHELQHLIYFYRKQIKNGMISDNATWLNEMCSMIAEDFASYSIGFLGPHGINHDICPQGNTCLTSHTHGRLPEYNVNNRLAVAYWKQETAHYAVKYAYASFLARSYNGPALFKKIVETDKTGAAAIDYALMSLGYSDNFSMSLRRWGASVLLSDKTELLTSDTGYGLNINSWFFSDSYPVSSLDLYRFTDISISPSQTGPVIYTEMPTDTIQPSSNTFLYEGNLTGLHEWTITAGEGIQITVVVR